MTVCLIGAYRSWQERILSPSQRARFVAALGVVEARPAEACYEGETFMASTGKKRGWRPQVCPDGSRILFAGHIDNRSQIANDLGIARGSDEALYAAGYAAWGDAVDLRVIGQFATIIIPQHKKEIRLTRSPISAPPLYFCHNQERLIVASLVNPFFANDEIERRLDYDKIALDLYGSRCARARSNFADISKVLCGQRAIATQAGVAVHTYYDISSLPEIRLKDDREYQAAATELLEEGVRAALDGFSRPAITLSGGFDSQAVAAIMARQRPGQLIEAFTCVPEPGWDGIIDDRYFGDERPYVEALAAMYPEIRSHWIDAAHLNFDYKQTSMFLAAGDPGPGTLGHFAHDIYNKARASGCDVLIEAAWGNDTFSYGGQGTLPAMALKGHWRSLWREARTMSKTQPHSAIRIIASQALAPLVPERFQNIMAKLLRRPEMKDVNPFETWCTLNPDFVKTSKLEKRFGPMMRRNNTRLVASSRQTRLENLDYGECGDAESSQAFAILYGMEKRDPPSYRPLVEFCLSIPDNQYFREGQSRWLARRMLNGLVPDMVVTERRRGVRMADWHPRLARQRSEMIEEFDRLIENENIAEMLDLKSLRQALIEFPDSPEDQIYSHWRLKATVLDGLTWGRFIRFIEGGNH